MRNTKLVHKSLNSHSIVSLLSVSKLCFKAQYSPLHIPHGPISSSSGDVVISLNPYDAKKTVCKRIAATAGEVIFISKDTTPGTPNKKTISLHMTTLEIIIHVSFHVVYVIHLRMF
jgi:hypothetical protein